MKIVQSCWSCNNDNLLNFGAGWCAPEYHLMGWALSCLQLRKYYNDVVLYADDTTATMLIDTLNLPYTEVVCSLNELNRYDSRLWALPKIYAYSKQTVPFLHVDGDVFIFKPFADNLLKHDLIAQNLEFSTEFYEKYMKKLESLVSYIPVEISEIRRTEKEIRSYNAGILGGNDVDFFKDYTKKAFECIEKNRNRFSKIELGVFNVFFEQCLFYALVRTANKAVGVEIPGIVGDTHYVELGDFHEAPFNRQYLHLLGNFKRNKSVCEQMAYRLRLDYPEFYYRIIALIKGKRLPLEKDYYYFLDLHTEDYLLKRYRDLKMEEATVVRNPQVPIEDHRTYDFATTFGRDISVAIESRYSYLDKDALRLIKKDIDLFSEKLGVIFCKFKKYDKEFLYKRDIHQANQGRLIFEDKNDGFERKIIRAPYLEIVECGYNWYEAYECFLANDKFRLPINTEIDIVYVGVVPECTTTAYSLVSIDNFDYLILEILESSRSVNQLIAEIKTHLEPDVIKYSLPAFENLVFNRIKRGLKNKTIEGIDPSCQIYQCKPVHKQNDVIR